MLKVCLLQYLNRVDLDRGSAGGRGWPWGHGALGLGLSLHLGQGLLVDHQQLPSLTSHQDHPCTHPQVRKGQGDKSSSAQYQDSNI